MTKGAVVVLLIVLSFMLSFFFGCSLSETVKPLYTWETGEISKEAAAHLMEYRGYDPYLALQYCHKHTTNEEYAAGEAYSELELERLVNESGYVTINIKQVREYLNTHYAIFRAVYQAPNKYNYFYIEKNW